MHLRPKQILNSCKTKCFLHFYCSTTVIDKETPPEKHIYTHICHTTYIKFNSDPLENEMNSWEEQRGQESDNSHIAQHPAREEEDK